MYKRLIVTVNSISIKFNNIIDRAGFFKDIIIIVTDQMHFKTFKYVMCNLQDYEYDYDVIALALHWQMIL